MKAIELRDRSDAELQECFEETKQALFRLTVRRRVADEAENPLKVRMLRRQLARIATVKREREGGRRHG